MSIPNNTYGIAIIGDGQITTSSGSRPYPTADILNVTGLAHIALAKVDGQRAMWIAPGSDLARKAHDPKFWKEFQLGPEPNWNVFATGPQDSTPNAASVRRTGKGAHKEDRREVMIYADLDTRWALETGYPAAFTPALMLQCIEAYERQMGVQARFTPASTALALLQKLHTDCSSVAYLDPLSRDMIDSIPWPIARAPGHANPHPMDGKYVHVFDKRSAYMASSMGEVGRGDPDHWDYYRDADFMTAMQKETPGLWCISAQPPTNGITSPAMAWEDLLSDLPSPFNTHGDLPDHEWYYTPQVKLAMLMGFTIQVHEAYIWPKHHRTLRPWVERLWQARQAVRGTPTEAMIKASFTQSLGVMARRPQASEKLQWYHRPDWSGMLTAQHYLRQVKKIMEVAPNYLAVSTDSVAIVSDEANWPDALPAGWLGKPGQLGEYRSVATYTGEQAQTLIRMARERQSGARLYKQMNEWDEVEADG
jgi:hypothetical protein